MSLIFDFGISSHIVLRSMLNTCVKYTCSAEMPKSKMCTLEKNVGWSLPPKMNILEYSHRLVFPRNFMSRADLLKELGC